MSLMRRVRVRHLFPGLILLAAIATSNLFFLFFRDNFSTHFPAKVVAAESLLEGHLPYWNFRVGGGQPLAGNPNTLTFYPTTLLYLLFPALSAFNLHFLVHLALAFATMRALCREVGATRKAASAAAAIYLLSGVVVSTLTFYNLICSVALLPFCLFTLLQFLRRRRMSSALALGAGCGLLALAGEPVMILATALLLAALAVKTARWRDLPLLFSSVVVALVVASPLLLAYSEISGEVERSFRPYSASTVLAASFEPRRMGEFLGMPTAIPGVNRPHDFPSERPWPPLLPFAWIGILMIPVLVTRQRGPALRIQIAAMVLLFVSLGRFNPLVETMVQAWPSIRIVRYPEKFLIPFAVLLTVLIALWLDREKKRSIPLLMFGSAILLAVVVSAFISDELSGGFLLSAVIQGAILCLISIRPLSPATNDRLAIALTLAVLAFWSIRSLPIDRADPYMTPGPLTELSPRRIWRDDTPLRLPSTNIRTQYRTAAQMVDPVFGSAHGLRYAFDRSPEGMYSYLSRMVQERMLAAPLPLKLKYLRLLGVEVVITGSAIEDPYVQRMFETDVFGNRVFVYGVRRTLPRALAVRALRPVRSVNEAFAVLESPGFDEHAQTVAPLSRRLPTGMIYITRFTEAPQRLTFEVSAPADGTLLINESFFSAWDARGDGKRLSLVPLNIDRLGVVVPKGTTRITLQFGRERRLVRAAMMASGIALVSICLLYLRSRNSIAEPAT